MPVQKKTSGNLLNAPRTSTSYQVIGEVKSAAKQLGCLKRDPKGNIA